MAKKVTRAASTGKRVAKSILEMVDLMYQNNTAKNFLVALVGDLQKALDKRVKEDG